MHVLIPSIAFLIVAGAVAFAAAVIAWFDRRDRRRRVRWLARGSVRAVGEGGNEESPTVPRPSGKQDRFALRERLEAANWSLSPRGFLMLSGACAAGVAVLALRVGLHPLLLLLLAACAATGPVLLLRHALRRHERRLVEQLPHAIEMISRALKSGQGIDEAMRETGERLDAPMGREIRRIYEEISLGLSFQQAMRHFGARYSRIADVRMLCAAMIIQRETGGNLTKLLDGLSYTIHERFRLRGQVRALTAEGRLSAAILASLPLVFAGIAWAIRPDYVTILTQERLGRVMLSGAVTLEIIGFAAMFLLARIDQ